MSAWSRTGDERLWPRAIDPDPQRDRIRRKAACARIGDRTKRTYDRLSFPDSSFLIMETPVGTAAGDVP
jgi:hypothetical protein